MYAQHRGNLKEVAVQNPKLRSTKHIKNCVLKQ